MLEVDNKQINLLNSLEDSIELKKLENNNDDTIIFLENKKNMLHIVKKKVVKKKAAPKKKAPAKKAAAKKTAPKKQGAANQSTKSKKKPQ